MAPPADTCCFSRAGSSLLAALLLAQAPLAGLAYDNGFIRGHGNPGAPHYGQGGPSAVYPGLGPLGGGGPGHAIGPLGDPYANSLGAPGFGAPGYGPVMSPGLAVDPLADSIAASSSLIGGGSSGQQVPVVTDTSMPVGFKDSATGTFATPRFPSTATSLGEPTAAMLAQCEIYVPAVKMTNGFSENLKNGSVQVYVNPWEQQVRIVATSSPRFTSKNPINAAVVAASRLLGNRNQYQINMAVPDGCVAILNDKNGVSFVTRASRYTQGTRIKLNPEVFATFSSSLAPLPPTIISAVNALQPGEKFKQISQCVFIAHFSGPAEGVSLTSSLKNVRVYVRDPRGEDVATLEIIEPCLPQSMHRISMWTVPVTEGTAVVVAFSPPPLPPNDVDRWSLLPTTNDEATFNRPYIRP